MSADIAFDVPAAAAPEVTPSPAAMPTARPAGSPASAPLRVRRRRPAVDPRTADLRSAAAADAEAIHALVSGHLAEGHLLPRTQEEVAAHAGRFVVAVHDGTVVGCADLAPLSHTVAEVRSLVVASHARAHGLGRRLLDDLARRASIGGFETLVAFTHSPAYFLQMGFSIVPHAWVPQKIEADCRTCGLFRRCGQYAVMRPVFRTRSACVPLAALHG